MSSKYSAIDISFSRSPKLPWCNFWVNCSKKHRRCLLLNSSCGDTLSLTRCFCRLSRSTASRHLVSVLSHVPYITVPFAAVFSRKLLFVSLFSQSDLPEKGQPKVDKIFSCTLCAFLSTDTVFLSLLRSYTPHNINYVKESYNYMALETWPSW